MFDFLLAVCEGLRSSISSRKDKEGKSRTDLPRRVGV